MSARANALALDSTLPGPTLLRALNGISTEIYFSAARRIGPEFRVRRATSRTYWYFDPRPEPVPAAVRRAAALFSGPVDTRSFGRGIPAATPRRLPVDRVRIRRTSGGRVIQVRARSFVWGMMRKIVGALREVEAGRLSLPRLEAAIRGEGRLMLPMAEPEGLVLWEVAYPGRWELRAAGATRHQLARVTEARARLWVRGRVLSAIGPAGSRRSRRPAVS